MKIIVKYYFMRKIKLSKVRNQIKFFYARDVFFLKDIYIYIYA